MPKREIITRNKKRVSKDSESSSESSSSSESDSEYKPSSEESWETASDGDVSEEFDNKKFKKTLSKLFPSKYSKKNAKCSESDTESDSESNKKRKHKSKQGHSKKRVEKREKSRRKPVEESEESDDDNEYASEEDTEEGTEGGELLQEDPSESKYKIVLTINGTSEADEEETEDDSDAEHLMEDENEECNSEDEETFMREKYEKLAPESEVKKKATKKNVPSPKSKKAPSPTPDFEKEYADLIEWKKVLVQQIDKTPKNEILKKSLADCKESINKLVRKARHTNTKEYHTLIHSDNKQANELEYFKKRLSNQEQKLIMRDLKEINKHIYVEKPYRLALLQSKMPAKFKAVAMQQLNTLKSMDPSDHEYYKIKNWVDNFMRIPFGIYRSIHVRMTDGVDACDSFLKNARNTLDTCVFGLNDAKMQIMQMMGQWIVNPNSVGSAIAIHGPPGTGKTSIVKDGISKILGREFAFIALGGCGDSSFLEGHSYTYEGSTWGKIVQILMDSKCMNPVIYFDELDKISDTPRGQEIIGILTHLTDSTQNSEFHDKYFSEVSFDLNKCLFIFSYNEEHLVNPILKDRMYRIQTKGYDSADKVTIARDYLLPKIREQVSFSKEDVIIPDETIKYIVGAQHLTKGESGVRNLKRCLEIIYTKLNLFRLIKEDNNMFEKELGIKVTFPVTITKKEVDVFIKNNEPINPTLWAMYT